VAPARASTPATADQEFVPLAAPAPDPQPEPQVVAGAASPPFLALDAHEPGAHTDHDGWIAIGMMIAAVAVVAALTILIALAAT
jgi:hypothetical protein